MYILVRSMVYKKVKRKLESTCIAYTHICTCSIIQSGNVINVQLASTNRQAYK